MPGALLRRVRNPDRIGEWQSRGGRIARDAEGQSGPERRGQGLVGRGSLRRPRALISAPGNSVVAVRSAKSIGRAGVLQGAQSTTGWSVGVIGNVGRLPK